MGKFEIDNILKLSKLHSELDLEQANSLYSRLRPLVKEDHTLKAVRKHLANLIEAYEEKHWSDDEAITHYQVRESDFAEKLVSAENDFIQERKRAIRSKLKKHGLIQKDLADILGHRENYMSELINGVRPFTQEDLIVIHRVLGIPLSKLFNHILKESTAVRIRKVIAKLNKPEIKLKDEDLSFELA